MTTVPPIDSLTVEQVASGSPKPSLTTLFNRLQPSPETVVLMLSIVIGTSTGLAVLLFHYLIEQIHRLMLEDVMGAIAPLGAWTLALIPAFGGVLVGFMRWRLQDFGPGISALIAAQRFGNLSPVRSIAKAFAATVSLGTGASLGPEGPSVELGGAVGVFLGQALQVSQDRLRLLLGAGAAAGLAAGFNAPIAGVFFALEVVLGTTFATSAVSLVLLSAVVSALITQIGQGGQAAFLLPAYEVRSPLELPLYLGLGLFASFVSIAYTQSIQLAQRFFLGQLPSLGWMANVPVLLRPVLGGLCVGVVALQFPQILGIGYETVEAMLRDVQMSLWLLVGLLLVKLAMTAISLGSGLVGGLFAPAMFLGASLGAAYGKLLPLVLPIAPDSIAAPPAYAMVGMAAVLAASARAPLTAILLLFELTRDYRIILPLMAAVGLSVWLVDRLKPVTGATTTVPATVLSPELEESESILRQLPVREAMHHNVLTLPKTMSVLQAGLSLTRNELRSALVVDDAEQLVGIVTLQDINRVVARWEQHLQSHPEQELTTSASQKLGDICTQDVLFAYEDEPLADAVARMAARGLHQLPVVEREASHRVLGMLDRDQVSLRCSLAQTQEVLRPYLKMATLPEPHMRTIVKKSA